MSDFFMWGGFVFCLLWHLMYLKVFFDILLSTELEQTAQEMINLNVIVSGIGLCYFGMQAFG
jgi:hypothetical protein